MISLTAALVFFVIRKTACPNTDYIFPLAAFLKCQILVGFSGIYLTHLWWYCKLMVRNYHPFIFQPTGYFRNSLSYCQYLKRRFTYDLILRFSFREGRWLTGSQGTRRWNRVWLASGQEWGLPVSIWDQLPSFTSFTSIDLEFLFQCIIGNIYLTLGLNVLLSGLVHMWPLKIIPVS